MNILELGKFYTPHHGGIETLLRSWCEGFTEKGARVDCVVANDGPRTRSEIRSGVFVHRCASYGTVFSTSISPRYLLMARNIPSTLCHLHAPNPLADLAAALCLGRRKLVISYHSDIIRQARALRCYGPLLRHVLSRASRIIVATPKHFEYSPWLAEHESRVRCIPFGIDLRRFEANVRDEGTISKIRGLAQGRKIILTVGRLVGYKGQRFLIEACRNLDVELWIVGSGPLDSELRCLAHELGIEGRTRFWGSIDDALLASVLHACDVFVLPSITANEAFGLVQVEAMACQKPVISCDLKSGVPFVNRHGHTGLIVPPGDPAALAHALKEVLSNQPMALQMGVSGKERAHAEFALQVMIDRYWQCFTDLARENSSA